MEGAAGLKHGGRVHERSVFGRIIFLPLCPNEGHVEDLKSTQSSLMRDHRAECMGEGQHEGPVKPTHSRMIPYSTDRDPLCLVVHEAVCIKDIKDAGSEVQNVIIDDIEKETAVKIKLLNSRKNEFHLPTTVAGDVQGIAEDF